MTDNPDTDPELPTLAQDRAEDTERPGVSIRRGEPVAFLEEDEHREIQLAVPPVFGVDPEKGGLEYLFQLIDERSGERPLVTMMNTEAPVRTLGEETITSLHEWQEANLLTGQNLTLYLHNPETMTDELQEFFVNNAEQVLRTWLYQNGLQYITLKKSPTGYLGSTRLIEYLNEEPYLRVQTPPGHRDGDR